jgi:hypothetical protein
MPGVSGDQVVLDLQPDAGEHRQGVVPACGDGDLGDSLGEDVAVDQTG